MDNIEIRCDTKEQVGLCLNKLFENGANWAMDGTTWSWKDGFYIVLHVECDLIRYSHKKLEPTKMDALQYLNR